MSTAGQLCVFVSSLVFTNIVLINLFVLNYRKQDRPCQTFTDRKRTKKFSCSESHRKSVAKVSHAQILGIAEQFFSHKLMFSLYHPPREDKLFCNPSKQF